MGQILAAGLANIKSPRPVVKEAVEETGVVVAHGLEKYLNAIGTIAAAAPLMGLLGTIIGMIEIFGSTGSAGVDPRVWPTAFRWRSTTRRWASSLQSPR